MIIELVGPPGSGKSTVAALLGDILRERNVQAWPAREMVRRLLVTGGWPVPLDVAEVWHGLGFCRAHPALARLVLGGQLHRPGSWRRRLLSLTWLFRFGGRRHFLERHLPKSQVAIFSEGLANNAVNYFSSDTEPPVREKIRCYVQQLPPADLLIHLRVPLPLCMARLTDRQALPKSWGKVDRQKLLAYVTNQSQAILWIVNEVQECGWASVTIDNSRDLDQVRGELQMCIQRVGLVPSIHGPDRDGT